ncbi:DUF6588 family protein [Lacinutrix jangbogonensis]|uniref:DUF6588 family protein n=1 Tax=Lacinutrix jangbogonensis TaxID=1469557 RepID=UPI00053E498D|nr:DUF6588 family protein [Lacinutrix jangbogonensis]
MYRLLFIVLISPVLCFSQNQDLDNVAGDLVFLTGQYVQPAAQATIYQSSSGWFKNAKTLELWDVDISIQGNLLFLPEKKKNFNVSEADLVNLRIQGDQTSVAIPTALGGESDVVFEGLINGEALEIDAPEGLNLSVFNYYQFQAAVGLWKGTTFITRYSPKIKINKTYYQVFGFGVQHNISQWIPSIDTSRFNLAALVSYSQYNVSDKFSPANLVLGTINSINVEGNSFLFNILVSKTVNKFDFTAAIGLTKSKFTYTMGGDGEVLLTVLNRALSTLDGDETNFKSDLGVNYNFNKFSINSNITFGAFTNLVIGLNYTI